MSKGKFSQNANQFFDDVRTHGAMAIIDGLNIEPVVAEQVANEIAYRLKNHWGGSLLYVAKFDPWMAHQRDIEIANAFTGHNHLELSRQFGLSLPYIYEILARVRKDKQPELFD